MRLEKVISVAIAGEGGSGKSTTGREVGNRLGWKFYGAGELFREWCDQKGIDEIGAASGPDEVHDEIDDMMKDKMIEGKTVVEGRVSVLEALRHRLPGVLKVLLVCDAEIRYQRIYERELEKPKDKRKYQTFDEARLDTIAREGENMRVFTQRFDGLSYLDQRNYNLVIDTQTTRFNETVDAITERVHSARPVFR